MPDPQTNQVDLFGILAAALKTYVEGTLKGIFSIAGDSFEVIELLGEAPGRFRVILQWTGELPAGDPRSGIVKHSFRVVVSNNRGLPILKGSNLSVGAAIGNPLMKIASDVRDFLRTQYSTDARTQPTLEYGGCEPVKVDVEGKTFQLDAYELTFRQLAALPRVTRAVGP